jgi:modulator of FtsH protease
MMDKWHSYFSVTAGASATLTGLIFVGISINLNKILQFRQLPARALGTLILLTNNLLVSSFCLIPDQTIFSLGVKISFLTVFVWAFNTRLDVLNIKEKDKTYRPENIQNMIFNQVTIASFIVSSIYMLSSNSLGIDWLVAGIAMSFVKAIVDAWVLVIEIQR